MIGNILVPYDFTNFADLAFEKAMEIATKFDSKLTLLTVIGSDIDTGGMSWSRAEEVLGEAETKTKKELSKIKDSKKGKREDISVEVVRNLSTVDGIISFTEKNSVDLIVMGSHGRSGFKKLVLGSVASGVITKSNCSVLIVKQHKKPE
jgi:nucleotide-binding universal stress UspA family protein